MASAPSTIAAPPAVAVCQNRQVLGVRIDATSYADAVQRCLGWARPPQSRYVCAANVHVVMEAHDDPAYRDAVNAADLVTPDGMPLVWMLRRLGLPDQQRVYGPDLMLALCSAAAEQGIPIGLFGSTYTVRRRCSDELRRQLPAMKIAYSDSPPFAPIAPADDAAFIDAINSSGAAILFVALGCPKQELWMARHRGQVRAVMVGVGAAFDFIALSMPQAPRWMQRAGLEWAFRFACEPSRLARRYLYHNPRFLALAAAQLLCKTSPSPPD